MIPEYKCRRCKMVIDGSPSKCTELVAIDCALTGKSEDTKGNYAPTNWIYHTGCFGHQYIEHGVRRPGTGIAYLIGGREK